jgi:hypothetical protein
MSDDRELGPPTMGDHEDAARLEAAYGAPSIETLEGLRYFVAVRCAQANLAAELLKPRTFAVDELEALDRLTDACAGIAELVERNDWANEDGE